MAATGQPTPKGAVKTLAKGVALLNVLAEHPRGLPLGELATHVDLPKATALRLLNVLMEAGLVRGRGGREAYTLGSHLMVLSSAYLESLDLRVEARDVLELVVREVNEVCHLGVLEEGQVVYLDKVDAALTFRMHSRIGRTEHAHSTAMGKAILAHATDEVVGNVIAAGLEAKTPTTITDVAVFREELNKTRARGYAFDDTENVEGVCCVAAPIMDRHGDPMAALSVSGPAERISADTAATIGKKLQPHALELSRRYGYRGTLPI